MAKPDAESDPSAVHPFGALGGYGSRGGGSPCTRWLADYRYRCWLLWLTSAPAWLTAWWGKPGRHWRAWRIPAEGASALPRVKYLGKTNFDTIHLLTSDAEQPT